jgi:hypothetical protein
MLDVSCILDGLYGGEGISKLQFLIQKIRYHNFFSWIFFLNFCHQNPKFGSVFSLKC